MASAVAPMEKAPVLLCALCVELERSCASCLFPVRNLNSGGKVAKSFVYSRRTVDTQSAIWLAPCGPAGQKAFRKNPEDFLQGCFSWSGDAFASFGNIVALETFQCNIWSFLKVSLLLIISIIFLLAEQTCKRLQCLPQQKKTHAEFSVEHLKKWIIGLNFFWLNRIVKIVQHFYLFYLIDM